MTRSEVLRRARQRQLTSSLEGTGAAVGRFLRIILEFDRHKEPAAAASEIRQKLGLEVSAFYLFAPPEGGPVDEALQGFIAVDALNVDADAIDGQAFELGYAMADATGAVTAEPDLGTDFFVEPGGNHESAGDMLGCWTPESQDVSSSQPYWAIDCTKSRAAWSLSPAPSGKKKGEGIHVFQPDTGVADHRELETGAIDQTRAYDFVANRPGAVDPLNYSGNPGHGTGTASVVVSRENGKMTGSAPLATLTPLRAIESVVVFDHSRVATAVEYARRNGANVITMSLGGAWSSSLRAAIGRAISDGVIVLAAAGNCVRVVVWPARYEEVVAVAGTDANDKPWRGTCRGDAVDISAPGEFVPRAKRYQPEGGGPTVVSGGQGTSFAVALTAGIAALWLAHHTVARVKAAASAGAAQTLFASLLRATARRPDGFDTSAMGAGVVDAKALLSHALAVPEAVAAREAVVDPYHSLHTLVAEAGGAQEALMTLNERRFAAELSYLVLKRNRALREAGSLEAPPAPAAAVSPTLRAAVSASGTGGLEAIVGR